MGVVVPERRLWIPPTVTEIPGTPVFFADGAIFHDRGETVGAIFFERRTSTCFEALRVYLPKGGFVLSRMGALEQFGMPAVGLH